MTIEPDALDGGHAEADDDAVLRNLTGGLVSLRFFRAALRRRRRLWLVTAVVGLLIGTGYHLVIPVKYTATATVYLAHTAASDSTVAAQNDLVMLDTGAVGNRAIALLGKEGRGLTPAKLFGKAPATTPSGNVLQVTISGPTPKQAVRRVDAVVTAYLSFRAQLYKNQEQSLVSASNKEIGQLQTEIGTLTSRIDAGGTLSPAQVAALQGERAAATTEVTSLEQSIQQSEIGTLSVVSGSHVITPGTAVPSSMKKALVLDGLSGLAAGLALGAGFVAVQAALSDRLRRREDVAAVLGAPVGVSVNRVRRRRVLPRFRRGMPAMEETPLRILVQYLDDQLNSRGPNATVLMVTMDDVAVPAAAMATLAGMLRAAGERVVLVDDTRDRSVGRVLGSHGSVLQPVRVPGGPSVTLLVPSKPWEAGHDERWMDIAEELSDADAVLVVANVDPALGAWHLRRWASDAIVTVTTGHSTPQRVAAVVELLEAAGVTVSSAILLDADPIDESAGLGLPTATGFERHLGLVSSVDLPT